MITEAPLLNAARQIATQKGGRLFRNQVGAYALANGRYLRSGLAPGSADLIGWTPVTVTPDMVGRTLAVFTSIEAKAPGGRVQENQLAWLDAVLAAGGIAGIARSAEDVNRILEA